MTKKQAGKLLRISQAEELKILRKITNMTASQLDLARVLNEVVKIVAGVTGADSVFIYLWDETQQSLVLTASRPPRKKQLGKIILRGGEGITGWVVQRKEPVAISRQAYEDPRFKGFDFLPEDSYEAFLSVPIVHKGKTIGAINAQNKKPKRYTQKIIRLIETIGKLVGGVIENARFYEDARQKALQFDSLVKVSKSVTSEKYLDEILNLIVVVTAEMLNSKICSIMLLDEKRQELAICATQSLSRDYRKKPNLKVDQSLTGQVAQSGFPRAFYDVRKEEKYAYRDLAVKENLTSMLTVPMIFKDKTIGVINVYTKEPHVFSEEEMNVLQVVANQAAVAVENTKLMEENLKAKEDLETRKLIERAKGILMRLNCLSEEAAYALIHKKSMDSCKPMKEVAASIVLMDEFKEA